MSRLGRPLGAADSAIEDILEQWGREVGSDGAQLAKLGWPSEAVLSRIIREGAGATQATGAPIAISDESMIVDKVVQTIPKAKTRRIMRLWYASRDRGNQYVCARRASVSRRTFQIHLQWGRSYVAEVLQIFS
jgi:hypothetical protein